MQISSYTHKTNIIVKPPDLVTVITCLPDFLKLNMEYIQKNIHNTHKLGKNTYTLPYYLSKTKLSETL